MSQVVRISAQEYIHVKDTNTNITKMSVGPNLLMLQDHQQIVEGPSQMIKIPPRHYCVIKNPAVRDGKEAVLNEEFDEVKVMWGELEVRKHDDWSDPFPLEYNEVLETDITAFTTVPQESALRLECIRPFKDGDVERFPTDQWLFFGPATYFPRIEVKVVKVEKSITIQKNQALKVRA